MIYRIGMVWRFLGAVKRLLWRTITLGGPVTVTEDVFDRRIAVCKACPHYISPQCSVCLCVIDLKARLTTEKCPKNLWTQ